MQPCQARVIAAKAAALAAIVAAIVAAALLAPSVRAQSSSEAGSAGTRTPNDYASAESWLCRPGKTDGPCTGIQNLQIVAVDGTVKAQPYRPSAAAKIDCFYVYPTSSEDRGGNSDMQAGLEAVVTADQFGQFGSRCRQFAPIYRSITLRGLRALLLGQPIPGTDPDLGYRDVLDAWNYYLAHDNHGRGVVLIGHSQGSIILTRLIRNEIEGKPVAKLLVSAILAGSTVLVPSGGDVGGTFKSTPICTRAGQFGCAIVFASYRASLPPSIDPPAHFGHAKDGLVAACTNPGALGSDDRVPLDAYMGTRNTVWTQRAPVDAPFVRLPGLISGQCVTRGEFRYLEITVNAQSGSARNETIPGDLMIEGRPNPLWGLHLIDFQLTMGNLLDSVDQQSQAWLAAHH
jgi:hypothetical protein